MIRLRLLAAAACAAAVLALPRLGASSPAPRTEPTHTEPTHTVWDSVYADTQAVHGDSIYKATCAKCHGPQLKGGDDGAALVGDEFFGNWDAKPLNALFDNIRNSMPPDNPKSLSRAQVTQLVAYLLSQNQFPAGAAPLTDDVTRLSDIRIVRAKP